MPTWAVRASCRECACASTRQRVIDAMGQVMPSIQAQARRLREASAEPVCEAARPARARHVQERGFHPDLVEAQASGEAWDVAVFLNDGRESKLGHGETLAETARQF